MPNFKLTFRVNFDNEVSGDSQPAGAFSRIVSAETADSACVKAEAMVGEQVHEREWLTEVLSVEQTDEEVPSNNLDQLLLQVRAGETP